MVGQLAARDKGNSIYYCGLYPFLQNAFAVCCDTRASRPGQIFTTMTDIEKSSSMIPYKEGSGIIPKETEEEVAIGYSESIENKRKSSPLWKLVRLLHAEETGVERITDDMRSSHSVSSMGILFLSINM